MTPEPPEPEPDTDPFEQALADAIAADEPDPPEEP